MGKFDRWALWAVQMARPNRLGKRPAERELAGGYVDRFAHGPATFLRKQDAYDWIKMHKDAGRTWLIGAKPVPVDVVLLDPTADLREEIEELRDRIAILTGDRSSEPEPA